MDVVTYILCKKYAQSYTNEQIKIAARGMTYKGYVESFDDLPIAANTIGDLYSTSSGEYVWTIEASNGELSNWKEVGKADLSAVYNKIAETEQKITDITQAIPKKVSELENDRGYLTEHQSLANYAKISDLAEVEGKIPSKVSALTNDAEFVTKTELESHHDSSKQDIISETNKLDYNLLANVPVIPEPDVNKNYVDTQIADVETKIPDISNLARKNDVTIEINNYHDPLKQDKLIAGDNIVIENNTIKALAENSDATIGTDFVTAVDVGNIPAGTQIRSNQLLRDVLYNILVGSEMPIPNNFKLYFGGSYEIPTSIHGLTEQIFTSESEFKPLWSPTIICRDHPVTEEGQYPTIAIPDKYRITKWEVNGFAIALPYESMHAEGYNIYYITNKSVDAPDGIAYNITIA